MAKKKAQTGWALDVESLKKRGKAYEKELKERFQNLRKQVEEVVGDLPSRARSFLSSLTGRIQKQNV